MPITGSGAPKPVEHGGDLGAVQRRFPLAPKPWIDLSTGINPVAYPIAQLPAEIWQRLPSRDAEDALVVAAARRYGVSDPATIVVAPGTQALIQLLPRVVPKSRVAIVGSTYAEHAVCWHRGGHEVRVVAGLGAPADVVVVVNPDNPTGRLLAPDALHAQRASLIVVDEAFIDLLPASASLAGSLPRNAVVLRSFGKTYGLAGLRLGFAIAPPWLAPLIRDEVGPWAVSGPALEIGRLALEDDAWLHGAADRLLTDGETLGLLLAAAGFEILGRTPLFRLASHPEAGRIADQLGWQGIHVRAFADRPTWLRFGLPASDDGFRRLADALQVPQKVR